jgi:hypothetical protein
MVFGYIPPSSVNMEELERQYSDFDDFEFVNGFIEAGGKWISFEEIYSSFDGSHLDSKSAIKLSYDIAKTIKTKTYLSSLSEKSKIKTDYYQFESKYVFQNNFENDTNNVWITDIAHSGNKVLVCDSSLKYPGLFQTNTSYIVNNKINTVLADMWVFYENENTLSEVVFDLKQNGKTLLWKGLEISYIVKPGNWSNVKFEFSVPNNVTIEDQLKVFIINTNKTKILIDDFTLNMF